MEGRRPGAADRSTIYQPKPGSGWEFNIAGIYDAGDGVDKTQFFFRYDYLTRTEHARQKGLVGWYVVQDRRSGAGRRR